MIRPMPSKTILKSWLDLPWKSMTSAAGIEENQKETEEVLCNAKISQRSKLDAEQILRKAQMMRKNLLIR